MPDSDPIPSTSDLQFQRAEPVQPAGPQIPRCVACQRPIVSTYFHAQGQVVCPECAARIESGQQAPPPLSLARAVLYGGAAALAGCILYAAVAMITGLEIGLIAIVVGIMVGKAIRYASNGLGGRPQQILAVVLTYFAITTSYIPVAIYQFANQPAQEQAKADPAKPADQPQSVQEEGERMSFGALAAYLLLLAAAAPFLSLGSGFSGLISIAIIFFGLAQAWSITARSEILVMGPYEADPAR